MRNVPFTEFSSTVVERLGWCRFNDHRYSRGRCPNSSSFLHLGRVSRLSVFQFGAEALRRSLRFRPREAPLPLPPKTPDYRGYSSTKLGDAGRSARSSCSTPGSPGSSGERGGRPVDAPTPKPPASTAPARTDPNFAAAWSEIGCRNEFGLAASRTAGLYLYARSASPRAPICSVNAASG